MELVDDLSKFWNVKIQLGDNEYVYKLYDTFDKNVILKKEFIDLIKDRVFKLDNFMAGDIITSIISPEGEEYSKYALFMLMIDLGDGFPEYPGDHYFLFALRKDGNIHLMGVANQEITRDEALEILTIALEEASKVKAFVFAFTKEEEEGGEKE